MQETGGLNLGFVTYLVFGQVYSPSVSFLLCNLINDAFNGVREYIS